MRHALLEVLTSIVGRRVPSHQNRIERRHVVVEVKLGELLDVRLHVLPTQNVLGYRHDKRTVAVLVVTGIRHGLVCVNVAQIHSLGCQDLLGPARESDPLSLYTAENSIV